MSKEELLKPRYKVIADWPEMRYRFKGKPIITLDKQDEDGWFTTNGYYQESFFKMYPHLFKRLEWWQERDEKDMPGYVKGIESFNNGKIFKVANPDQDGRVWHNDNEIEHRHLIRRAKSYIPATESEYNEYINQKA